MKSLNIALAAGLAFIAVPASAQQQLLSDSDQFIEAVQKSDGDKATELVQSHPTIVDARNNKGDTGLIIAIGRKDPNWTGFLLNNGADPNLPGANGDTPLIEAAKVGFDDAIGWLLGLGAKVDETNKMGETALIIAVQQSNRNMVKSLLDAGADPDRTDAAAGYSARDYAIRNTRARDILKLIDAKKPKGATAATK